MTKLTNLDLEYQWNLKGTIPTELGDLTGLKSIDFVYNSMTGKLPTELGKLDEKDFDNFPYDYSFSISDNRFCGDIPTEVSFIQIVVNNDPAKKR